MVRGRRRARERAMQALYQWQIQDQPIKDVCNQFLEDDQGAGVDIDYFKEIVLGAAEQRDDLDARISAFADRDLSQLDPVEHAILWVGFYELLHRIDVPYRVVLDEAVELARIYGAEDGHKYVNAVMDRAAAELRAVERRA
jgi:N utilization substance protein B